MPKKKIIILGTGGNCVDILDTLRDINDAQGKLIYECVGFLDDNPDTWSRSVRGARVLGPLGEAVHFGDCFFVFGIGSVSNFWRRRDILAKTKISDERFETILHPTASVSRMAKLEAGVVVFQNATITSSVHIGRHVCILPNSVISHDDVIGDFTCVAGGVCVSGNVRVGHSCYLGAGSAIKEGVEIGSRCLIGMGSVVLKDVPENSVMVGNPARFLRNVTLEEAQ